MFVLPAPTQYQPHSLKKADTVYVSKRATVKEVIQKLQRLYERIFEKLKDKKWEIKLWKVDPRFSLEREYELFDLKVPFLIQGTVLDENLTIEVIL